MGRWSTPDTSLFSNPLDCRKISVPGDLWFYVQGALEEMCKAYNWVEDGTATPEETAVFFMGVMDEFTQSNCVQTGGGMFSVSTFAAIEILSMNQVTHPSGIGTILPAVLPVQDPMPTGLYCLISGNSDSAVELAIRNGLLAQQLFDYLDGYNKPFAVLIPFSEENVVVRLLDVPDNYTLSVRLVGWW